MRCELCGERISVLREDEARQCATCAAVLEDSCSNEECCKDTLAEMKQWLKKTENHRPCPGIRGINGLIESSKSSSSSSRRKQCTVAEKSQYQMINSLNIAPTCDGAHLAEDFTTKHCLFRPNSSSTQLPLPIATNQAEDTTTTPSDGAHLAET